MSLAHALTALGVLETCAAVAAAAAATLGVLAGDANLSERPAVEASPVHDSKVEVRKGESPSKAASQTGAQAGWGAGMHPVRQLLCSGLEWVQAETCLATQS